MKNLRPAKLLTHHMEDFTETLQPTKFVDSDHPEVMAYAKQVVGTEADPKQQAIKLYYAIRDGFRYDPYHIDLSEEGLKASTMLARGSGYCVEKANLLAATARALGIPSRFGFADVKNHFTSEKLTAALRSDIFAFHGFTELYLDGKWVKATPAFNKGLCEKMGVAPLEFNGEEDSIFQPFSADGSQFMEYVHDHGLFNDIPREYFIETLRKHYPHMFEEKLVIKEEDEEGTFKY